MNSEGIGLGLLISKQLVEANGGELKAYSLGIGHGSQFTFVMKMQRTLTDKEIKFVTSLDNHHFNEATKQESQLIS